MMLYSQKLIYPIRASTTYIECPIKEDEDKGIFIPYIPNSKPRCILNVFLNKYLTEYKKITFEIKNVYYTVIPTDEPNIKLLRLPYYFWDLLKKELNKYYIFPQLTKIEPWKIQPVTILFKEDYKPRDELQYKAVQYLSDPNPNFNIRFLEIQTGKGKTFCALYSTHLLGLKTLIVVPASLLEQWRKKILEYTHLKPNNIYIIKGSKKLLNLAYMSQQQLSNFKYFLASITTIQKFIKDTIENNYYQAYPHLTFEAIMSKTGIGIKIVDEAHLNFAAIVNMDLHSNFKYNWYLTATGGRSERKSDFIFNKVFPKYIRFKNFEIDKYINVIECYYDMSFLHEDSFTIANIGYSQNKYEKFLLRRHWILERLVKKVFVPLLQNYYIPYKVSNEKCFIFIGLKEFGIKLKEVLQEHLPNLKIDTFYSEDKDEKLFNNDVIITTIGSCGTGKDLPKLKCVLSFVSFSSKILSIQVPGRLRKDENLYFVCLINRSLKSHVEHVKKRRYQLVAIAKKLDSIYMGEV